MEGGYFTLGRFGGAPVRIHWTMPIGAFAFCGFRWAPAAWGAFLLLILIHEVGHATMVRAHKLHVAGIDVHGIGGLCHWYGTTTPVGRALIAWGGVFGQLVLLAIAVPVKLFALPAVPPWWAAQLVETLVYTNLYLMAINLLPVPGFDGAEAWKLFGKNGLVAWWRRRNLLKIKPKGVVRSMPLHRPFRGEDILEKTPTSQKRPPPHMLN